MKIAIIGAGEVGGTLGRAWLKAGHEVMFGVQDPASVKTAELLASTNGGGRAGRVTEAARFGDVVAIATPWHATRIAIEEAGDLAGKIIIDSTNPLEPDLSALSVGNTTSGGRWCKSGPSVL